MTGISIGLAAGVCAGLIGYAVAGFAEAAALFDLVLYGAAGGAIAGFAIGAAEGCARARVHARGAVRARR